MYVVMWSKGKNFSKLGECQLCNVSSLTLKEEMKLALICQQTQNVLFCVLERETFVQNVRLR
jgi:hypothetical protein